MAGVALGQRLPGAIISTSGTHVIEGMPISWRTREAIAALGLPVPGHRSRQATAGELAAADLVIALATDHVAWIRRIHPEVAERTATLRRLAADLPVDGGTLRERVASLELAEVSLDGDEDVTDPAGGDEELFHVTAREIDKLVKILVPRLS